MATSTVPQAVLNASPNVARVHVADSVGSGTYLGGRLVLSCAHVFGPGQTAALVHFPDGQQIRGKAAAISRDWDQSLIELESDPARLAGVPLAAANPQRGDLVAFVGYPAAGNQHARAGRVTGYYTRPGGTAADWFNTDAPIVGGYSGGGAFDSAGRLIGNLWGANPEGTMAVATGRTHLFLEPWTERLERAAAARTGGDVLPSQFCQPGGQAYGQPTQPRAGPGLAVGPRGPAGEPGPPGQPGPRGPPGMIDAEALRAILDRLDRLEAGALRVELHDASGRVIAADQYRHGDTLILHTGNRQP